MGDIFFDVKHLTKEDKICLIKDAIEKSTNYHVDKLDLDIAYHRITILESQLPLKSSSRKILNQPYWEELIFTNSPLKRKSRSNQKETKPMTQQEIDKRIRVMEVSQELYDAINYYFDVLKEVRGENWDKTPDHVLKKMLDAMNKANGQKTEKENRGNEMENELYKELVTFRTTIFDTDEQIAQYKEEGLKRLKQFC